MTGTGEEVCEQIQRLGQIGIKGIFNVLPGDIDAITAMRDSVSGS